MKITVNKYCATALLNYIRCAGLTLTKEVRPIAIEAGDASTVLEVGDTVEEDMTELINNVCDCKFEAKSNSELLKWSGDVNGLLTFSSINSDEVTALSGGDIMHSIGPTIITIYFRNSNGCYTKDDNAEFLKSNNVFSERVIPFASRHSTISNFQFEEIEREGDNIVYEVNITSEYGVTFDDLVARAKDEIVKLMAHN